MPALLTFSLLALTTIHSTTAWYQPSIKTSWQCVLNEDVGSLTLPVEIYDFDLFTNSASTIEQLHKAGKKVICYFSAGTYEPGRPDSAGFSSKDIGSGVEGWPDEKWLNIKSARIVEIMKRRIDLAFDKGCDGVDPDNDAYGNGGGGFNLQPADSITYLKTLSTYAHNLTTSKLPLRPSTAAPSNGIAIGLKNAAAIVPDVVSFLDFVVNEQCIEFRECDTYQPFIKKGKPVFHIEYLKQSPNATEDCFGEGTDGFSTILKPDENGLPATVKFCPGS